MYKIKYTLNILPIIGEHFSGDELVKEETKLLDICVNSDELCIFDT